jgi:hypothetical protein
MLTNFANMQMQYPAVITDRLVDGQGRAAKWVRGSPGVRSVKLLGTSAFGIERDRAVTSLCLGPYNGLNLGPLVMWWATLYM